MRKKLTLLVPCKDEAKNIRPCIESARAIVEEVLVADSGSTDRTMEIARELGARIIEREYVNSADFKNWALPQVKTPWVLIVDADERVTSELAAEIEQMMQSEPAQEGYWIGRRSYFMGQLVQGSGWGRDKVLRLFKSHYRYRPKRVHAEVEIATEKVGRLTNKLDHFSFWSMDQYFEKFVRYTRWAATDLQQHGKRSGWFGLTVRPLWRFFRHFVIERGFLEGKRGLIVSALGAFTVFVKQARLWANEHGLPQPDPEAPAEQSGAGAREGSQR